jgi:hypothetical protein
MKFDIRTRFLETFTMELIKQSEKPEKIIFSHHPVKSDEVISAPAEIEMKNLNESLIPSPFNLRTGMSVNQFIPQRSETGDGEPQIFKVSLKDLEHTPLGEVRERKQIEIRPGPILKPLPPKLQPRLHARQMAPAPPSNPNISSIVPAPQPLPVNFDLGKINPFVYDNKITSIECPGPGKIVLIKAMGSVSTTNITLSDEEIKDVIVKFSQVAKIPLIEGVFKAAVGNLMITAVISGFVGSRFVITKYTPYSLIYQ